MLFFLILSSLEAGTGERAQKGGKATLTQTTVVIQLWGKVKIFSFPWSSRKILFWKGILYESNLFVHSHMHWFRVIAAGRKTLLWVCAGTRSYGIGALCCGLLFHRRQIMISQSMLFYDWQQLLHLTFDLWILFHPSKKHCFPNSHSCCICIYPIWQESVA